jgi:hypothetical protein
MPINRKHYAPDWPTIALRVKNEADWTCQRCQRLCVKPKVSLSDYAHRLRSRLHRPDRDWLEQIVLTAVKETPQRFRLTVAHLNQDPLDNRPQNLQALCSICHLDHDRPFRRHNTYRKRERYGQLPLPQL